MFGFNKQFCCVLLVALSSLTQAQQRLIAKVISLADSTVLPFAIIGIPELNYYIQANEVGSFELPNLPKALLKLTVSKLGFKNMVLVLNPDSSEKTLIIRLTPDLNTLDEIVVYGNQQSLKSETANNIEVIESQTMREQGAMNLSDGISKLPGVSQLSTGAGISKPVIRGLFGNRIQTLFMGLRFDNQQWQDEHGLGLSDIGIDRVEIIKGPSTLFYGSEAMGGVLNIIGEKPALLGKMQVDVGSRYFSNTFGYAINAGIKQRKKNYFFGLRVGTESHGDYSDGNNKRILNSRFGGNLIKGTFGFNVKKWSSENNYVFGLYNFGFLMDAYQLFDKPDDRWSRTFERPHHTVIMNVITSQNTVLLKASKLKIVLGSHFNNRQEQEGASGISLNMYLNTYAASCIWTKQISSGHEVSIGSQNNFQTNVNNGSRIIVPDANLGEASVFAYYNHKQKFLTLEGGLRYDSKHIKTLATGVLNNGNPFNPGRTILPIKKNYNTLNGSLGLSVFDTKHWNLKINASSGYRGPNLAELSSNGLHEGSVRYELGNTNLKTEQNICSDVFVEYSNKNITFSLDAYVNRFYNYIYLQPSTGEYLGFVIYNYIQKNATLFGFEGGLKIHPKSLKGIQLHSVFSTIVGETDEHQYLPFIPAQKLSNELKLKFKKINKIQNSFLSVQYNYVFKQTLVNQFETSTNAYKFLNVSAGCEINKGSSKFLFSLSVNNLLNEAYYDHLSRFKYFGIYNIGRSLNINVNYQFN